MAVSVNEQPRSFVQDLSVLRAGICEAKDVISYDKRRRKPVPTAKVEKTFRRDVVSVKFTPDFAEFDIGFLSMGTRFEESQSRGTGSVHPRLAKLFWDSAKRRRC